MMPAPSGMERALLLRMLLNSGFLVAMSRISGFGVTMWCWPFCVRKLSAIWVASLRVALSNLTPSIFIMFFGIGKYGFYRGFL